MRIAKIILLSLLALALITAAAAWWQSRSLAENLIRDYLAERNIPVESLTVVAVGSRHATLGDIALGEGGALRAKEAVVQFHYDWKNRILGDVKATLTGVEMRAQVQDGEVLLGGVEKAWSTALVTPNDQAIAVLLNGDLVLNRTATGAMDAVLTDGSLSLSQSQKNLLLPLQLKATAKGTDTEFSIDGTFASKDGKVDGTFAGMYDRTSKSGELKWNTQPMDFAPDGFTFAQVSPFYAADLDTIVSRLAIAGTLTMKPKKWTVAPKLTIHSMPLEALLKDALGGSTQLEGRVKGDIPITIDQNGGWRINKSRLVNIGPMQMRLAQDTPALSGNPQAEMVKGALSNLQIDTLTLDIQSTDSKGGVKLQFHFLGRNPDFLGGKKVDLNLAVTANLQDMWRSMQQVKALTREAEKELMKQVK